MDLSNPIHSVIPSVQGDVLGVLGRTSRPLSGRGVADLLDGRASTMGVSLALRALVGAGLVLTEEHPPAILYRLNREHLAADAVVELATLRERLIESMHELIATWGQTAYGAWIFGSFTRGTASSQSDIDVMVVRPDEVPFDEEGWRQQVREFSHRVSAWSGNDCRVAEFSLEEFMQLFEGGERLATDLRRDGLALTRRRLPSLRSLKADAS